MHHFFVDTSHSGIWFSLIYLFATVMVISVFIIRGVKGNHPFVSLWLIAVTGMLFFIAGTDLFTLSLQDWKLFILHGTPSHTGEKSVLGGMLVFLGLLIAIYWLKERVDLIDNLAVAFIIGIGMQNIGCLLAGCCFGSPSTVPWAVQYDKLSPAFGSQVQQGLVQVTDNVTAPIHPVQLYLFLGCLLIAFVVWKTRNRWHTPLSMLIFGWLLYAVLRFAMEFMRDPVTNHGAGYIVYGLKAIQWYLIAMMIVFGGILIFRERKFRFKVKSSVIPETSLHREITLLLFVILFSWLLRGLFGFTEKLILNSFLILSVFLVGWKVFKTYTLTQYRIATLLTIIGSCALLGQSYIPQSDDEKTTYTEIGGGLQYSQYYYELSKNLGQQTDCEGNPFYATGPPHQTRYDSYMGGLSISKTRNLSKYNRFSYGSNVYFGADRGKGIDSVFSQTLPNIGVNPYVSGNIRWVGLSAGVQLGAFPYIDFEQTEASAENVGEMVGGPKTQYIAPSISLRVGPYDLFYVEYFLASHFPSASPLMYFGGGIGSGLGKLDGRYIGIGAGSAGMYFKTMYPVKENYYLDGFISLMPNSNYNNQGNNNSRFMLSVGMHHRFNYKTGPLRKGN